MFLRQIYDDSLAQAAYLVGCQKTGEALVIDPERDIDRYFDLAARERLRITAVAETHIHADFLSGARDLAQRAGATLYLSRMGGPDWSSQGLDPHTRAVMLAHADTFRIGNVEVRALHTPGHTPEHLCFLLTDTATSNEPIGLFSGDFVFVGDMGRPDLLETAVGVKGAKESSARDLFASLKRFSALPEYLQVWPGHGAGSACGKALGAIPQSTVGYEQRTSPALRAARDGQRAFLDYILAEQPEPPAYFARMKRLNRDGPPSLTQLPAPTRMTAQQLHDFASDARNVVIDTRPWDAFRAGHLHGALSIILDKSFPTIAGSYIDEHERIALLVDPAHVDDAVRLLVRVGLDHVVGFASPNVMDELQRDGAALETTPQITPNALRAALERGESPTLLDVRRAAEHAQGAVGTAPYANISHTTLAAHLDEVPRADPLIVHCQAGVRSARASAYLQRKGFHPVNLEGGYAAWLNSNR